MLAGNHLDISSALDISGLGWTSNNFYYKLKFTTTNNSQTPVVSEVNLLRKATQVNAPITNQYAGPSLVGNWSFNGQDMDWASTTAEALDRSGNSNNGNVVNGAKPVAGKVGQALQFDGVDDYVSANFQFSVLNFQSISNWINFQTLATGKPIIGKWGNSQNAILIKTDDVNSDEIKICAASGLTDDCANAASTTDANLTVKNWHNLQVVYDGTQSTNADKLKLYLDGSQKTLSFIGTIPTALQNSSANLEIGGDSDLGGYVSCFIDEVRIYNRALSEDEIGQLYRAGARTMKIIPTKSGKTIIKP
ncbi:LamG domain-containing protein [Patescibacteria group bacterium]|nr:LamG domain-containing protein [Patescibacteria group bacterium]MBU4455736.1 LamG domain-containing protein [Patescibacteria group bacterium]